MNSGNSIMTFRKGGGGDNHEWLLIRERRPWHVSVYHLKFRVDRLTKTTKWHKISTAVSWKEIRRNCLQNSSVKICKSNNLRNKQQSVTQWYISININQLCGLIQLLQPTTKHQTLSPVYFLNDGCSCVSLPAVDAIESGKSVLTETKDMSMPVAGREGDPYCA